MAHLFWFIKLLNQCPLHIIYWSPVWKQSGSFTSVCTQSKIINTCQSIPLWIIINIQWDSGYLFSLVITLRLGVIFMQIWWIKVHYNTPFQFHTIPSQYGKQTQPSTNASPFLRTTQWGVNFISENTWNACHSYFLDSVSVIWITFYAYKMH